MITEHSEIVERLARAFAFLLAGSPGEKQRAVTDILALPVDP